MFKSLLAMNYIYWLIASSVFFAFGEFVSKKFALNPKISLVIYMLIFYSIGALVWLPAILQKNQLSIVGVLWSVMSMLTTILLGLFVFGEKLSVVGIFGVMAAFVAIILLSIA
jgi:multidrug transporter EmrE-like cation transporter